MVTAQYSAHKKAFSRFALIGFLATALEYGLFYILLTIGFNSYISSAVGYVLGVYLAFIWNRKYTFHQKRTKLGVEVVKFVLIYLIALIFILLFLDTFLRMGFDPRIANFFAILCVSIINYIGNHYFVYSETTLLARLFAKVYDESKYLILYAAVMSVVFTGEAFLNSLLTKITSTSFFYDFLSPLLGLIASFFLLHMFVFSLPKKHIFWAFLAYFVFYNFFFLVTVGFSYLLEGKLIYGHYSAVWLYCYSVVFLLGYYYIRKYVFCPFLEDCDACNVPAK